MNEVFLANDGQLEHRVVVYTPLPRGRFEHTAILWRTPWILASRR
jgi:hypothetical protein